MRPARSTLFLLVAAACTPSQEAVQVQVPVTLDGSTIGGSVNDLGWTVTLSSARVAVSDLQFTVQGEMHAATAWLGGWFIGRAWAHPGHDAGGEVTGELRGDFILDWLGHDGVTVGAADMLTGDYNGLDFSFRAAGAADGLAADDPLLGHTAHYAGVARKDGAEVAFTAVLDIDAGTRMIGAPFELTLSADTPVTIGVQLEPTDLVEQRSMFDGLDFAALDDDADGAATIEPGSAAANVFRRAIQSHVHYQAEAQ